MSCIGREVDARPPDIDRDRYAEAPSELGPSANASSSSDEIRALLARSAAGSDSGDCSIAIDIRDDGSFVSPAGPGRWTLDNEYLTLTGEGRDMAFAVQEIDPTRMATVNPRGRIGRWSRC